VQFKESERNLLIRSLLSYLVISLTEIDGIAVIIELPFAQVSKRLSVKILVAGTERCYSCLL